MVDNVLEIEPVVKKEIVGYYGRCRMKMKRLHPRPTFIMILPR
jgi:hypothetical protein